MSYDRLAPTISSKAKKLFGSGNMGQNNGGGGNLKKKISGRNVNKNIKNMHMNMYMYMYIYEHVYYQGTKEGVIGRGMQGCPFQMDWTPALVKS